MISMTMILRFSCCLLFLVASCTGTYRTVQFPPPDSQPAPASRNGERVSDPEPADTTCSYLHFLLAKMAESSGHLEEARMDYEQALACDPQAVHVMRSLAVLLVKTGQIGEAVAWLDEILIRQPDHIQSLTLLANLHAMQERPAEAVALYQEILSLDPRNFHAALLLGTIHARNRQFEEAREVLRELVRTDPHSYVGLLYLAKLHQELHEFAESLVYYHEALDLNWSDGLAFEIAELYERLSRFPEAADLYDEILARDDTSERARGGLASVYLQQGDPDRALKELEKLRAYATDIQKVDFAIGQLLLQQGLYEEASRKFAALLSNDPKLDKASYLLAYIRYEQGDLESSKELLLSVPPHASVYDDATLLLIRIMQEEGDLPAVENVLLERLALESTSRSIFYLALAAFYQEHEQPERVTEVFAEALEQHPDDFMILLQYGMFLERQKRSEEAMEQMQKVLLLEPANPHALNYVGYTWADQGINLRQALEYIEEAVAQLPKDGFIRDSLGWVYFRMGEFEKALEELERAVELEPEDPIIQEHLGDVYRESRKLQPARNAYLRALELSDCEDRREEIRRKLESLHDGE